MSNVNNLSTANEAIKFCNSYSILPSIITLHYESDLSIEDWLSLLGEHWTCCDNIYEHQEQLSDIFSLIEPHEARLYMMSDEDKALFDSLPDYITIFRGCSAINMSGMSWSLSREIAEKIPTLNRYKPPQNYPVIIMESVISKHDILSIKTDRQEQEVVLYPVVSPQVIFDRLRPDDIEQQIKEIQAKECK